MAAGESPPMCIGGHGCCRGLGRNPTGWNRKNSPSCSTTSSLNSRWMIRMVSSTRRPRVLEGQLQGLPFLGEPTRPDAELEAAARHGVNGGDRARRNERVAQADVVDVGAEPQGRGLRRHGGDLDPRVVRRSGRRDRRLSLVRGVRRAGHGHGHYQMLGHPDRLESCLLRRSGQVCPPPRAHHH